LCLGSAKPIACDGPEGRPRRGGRERDNETAEEDDTTQLRLRARVSPVDQRRTEGVRAGARPAGASPRPEAGRYRRPAAPRSGAALIPRSPLPGSAAKLPRTTAAAMGGRAPAGPGPPGAATTPLRCPPARSPRVPPAGVYTSPDGKRYRPSMFLTLTCDSYGRVRDDGTPADPAAYDYTRAARDAIHFAALLDRFIQNLRRVLGYEAQYFGGVEPQQRLAPHIHLAMRGSVPRPLLRQVLAATYHQVWWPATEEVRFAGDVLPMWDEDSGNYVDPTSGEVLRTWDDALDEIGPADQPRHVARFGPRFDAQGVLAGSKDANRCIGYLTKYLTKQVAECHVPETAAQQAHADRLAKALRYEPCSPTCANWLRFGIQPKNSRPGLIPGACKGKAHRPEHCGYAGRRVLVSRKWSGKTLADHRADRKAWLVQTLGLEVPDPARYTWAQVTPSDPDYLPPEQRLLHVVADRARWKAALTEARRRAGPPTGELSATGSAA